MAINPYQGITSPQQRSNQAIQGFQELLFLQQQKRKQAQEDRAEALKLQQQKQKFELDSALKIQKQKFELEKKYEQQDPLKQAQADFFKRQFGNFQSSGNGDKESTGGFQPKSFSFGGFSFEKQPSQQEIKEEKEIKLFDKAQQEIQKEIIQGTSGEVGGRVSLAKESIKNIKDIKKILFPDGTPKSFRRDVAFGANPPGPARSPAGTFSPLRLLPGEQVKSSQEVFRKIGASLSGRQLIQTGVAARPEETEKLIAQFAPNVFSNPEAAFNGLTELEEFYNTYLNQTDPERRFPKATKRIKGSQSVDIDLDNQVNAFLDQLER